MNIAIITARGGSKRIPKKNIRDFSGKPILSYSIGAAVQSGIFNEVMISTEDDEIAGIAGKYGAVFPFRRSVENSDDHAMTVDVILEVVGEYEKRGIYPKNVCCIYPTAPFITQDKLRNALEMLEKEGADAVIPVVRFSFPPQRCFVLNQDGSIRYKWKENELVRSQDLEPLYHDAGQFYFIRTDVLKREKTLIPQKTMPIIVSEMEVQDIDNYDDWELAEIKYRNMRRKKHEEI